MTALDELVTDPVGCSVRSDPVVMNARAELAELRAAINEAETRARNDRIAIGKAIDGDIGFIRTIYGGNAPERIQHEIDAAIVLNRKLADVRTELRLRLQDLADASSREAGYVTAISALQRFVEKADALSAALAKERKQNISVTCPCSDTYRCWRHKTDDQHDAYLEQRAKVSL